MNKAEYLLSKFGPKPKEPELTPTAFPATWAYLTKLSGEAWDAAMEENNYVNRGEDWVLYADVEAALTTLRSQVLELQAALKEVWPMAVLGGGYMLSNVDGSGILHNAEKLANEPVRG
jgi:hypothetical protein